MENLKMEDFFYGGDCVAINRELAKCLGLRESVVLQQIYCIVKENERANINLKNGECWVYNSIADWVENYFCFFSESTVQRIFSKLERLKILKTKMFNKSKGDKTKWYSIDYEVLFNYYKNNTKELTKYHGYVYFVKDTLGCIKIGYTKDIKKRIEQIKNIRKSEIKIIHSIKTSNMVDLEAFFHEKFNAKRIEGEWFKLNKADIIYIKNGKFPKDILKIVESEGV